MPQPNDYSFDLKHRLVGAAVLIVAAVIVLPFILPGQKQDHRQALIGNGGASVPIQQTFISRIEVDNPDVFAQQNSAESVSDESEPGKESDTQESAKDVKDQGVDDNRPVTDSIGLPSGWVVRVGVFQIAENAKKRQSLLDENGFNVNLEETKLDGKTAIRVFLGPFSTEDEAERMKAQAVMVTNDKAFVARYP
jgi:cell division septation protein DedD